MYLAESWNHFCGKRPLRSLSPTICKKETNSRLYSRGCGVILEGHWVDLCAHTAVPCHSSSSSSSSSTSADPHPSCWNVQLWGIRQCQDRAQRDGGDHCVSHPWQGEEHPRSHSESSGGPLEQLAQTGAKCVVCQCPVINS